MCDECNGTCGRKARGLSPAQKEAAHRAGTYVTTEEAGTAGLSCEARNSLAAVGIGDPCGPGDAEWDAQIRRLADQGIDLEPFMDALTGGDASKAEEVRRLAADQRRANADLAMKIKAWGEAQRPRRREVHAAARNPFDLPTIEHPTMGPWAEIKRWPDRSEERTDHKGHVVKSGPRFRQETLHAIFAKSADGRRMQRNLDMRAKAGLLPNRRERISIDVIPRAEARSRQWQREKAERTRAAERRADLARLDREWIISRDDMSRKVAAQASIARLERYEQEERLREAQAEAEHRARAAHIKASNALLHHALDVIEAEETNR